MSIESDLVGKKIEISEQHKKIVDTVDKISEFLNDSNTLVDGKPAVDGLVHQLLDYSIEHFKFEEESFKNNHEKDIDRHKYEHLNLIEHFSEFAINPERKQLETLLDAYCKHFDYEESLH